MAASTGPMLAVGGITWANRVLLGDEPDKFGYSVRVFVGTGIAALILGGVERVSVELAKGIAWVALVAVCLTRIGGKPSPAENLARWWAAS